MALFGKEQEPEDSPARVGALLLADGLHSLREVGGLVRGLAGGRRRRG